MPRNPGSVEARAAGCRCPQSKNRDGAGAFTNGRGEVQFFTDKRCPLHGDDKYRVADA